jgi:two-component system, OmpR family, response regulator
VKVLIVDDDPLMRELGQFALSLDPAFDTRDADGGAAALALLASPDWQPDLILLDMHMPGMDGTETFARLPRDITIAVLTAAPEEAEPLLRLGAVGVISKPIDPMTFADAVRSVRAAG